MEFKFYSFGELGSYRYADIVAVYKGKWIFCKHRDRTTWEMAGGHIEEGETPLMAAKRELFEETGAIRFDIEPLCDYWVEGELGGVRDTAHGKAFFAWVYELGELPDYSEMKEVKLFGEIPRELTYPGLVAGLKETAPMLFSKENISVRKMNNDHKDMSLLLEWLTIPAVVELAYSEGVPWDMEKVRAEFGTKAESGSETTPCIIMYEGKEIGYTQFYPIEEDSYVFNENVPYTKFVGGYGVDIFIGYPDLWGMGIGAKMIEAMVEYLMMTYNAKVVCADPEESNERSVKCWTKAGLSRMGEIRNYDDPDKISVFMARFR